MTTFIKILNESVFQAIQALNSNRLRSFLSLLGISIGIFCLISVFSVVDSLEKNIRESFEELGSDVIFIHKWSFKDGPPGMGNNYWKYMKRPQPAYSDFEVIQTKIKDKGLVGITTSIGQKTISYRRNSVDGGKLMGVTAKSDELMALSFEDGRYFTAKEIKEGNKKVILGYVVAQELFGAIPAVGKKIKVSGKKLEVIGILKIDGDNLFNFTNFDESLLIPYALAKQYVNLRNKHNYPSTISIKAKSFISFEDLKEETKGVIRANRQLKPTEADNFSINEISLLNGVLDKVFLAMTVAGSLIGVFSMIVGMFGVANIMFVSVKERTKIIGIKKALGAKSSMILLEFLMESIILCLMGGLVGLLFVAGLLFGVSYLLDFQLSLSVNNILTGLILSVLTGMIAGFIPAYQAAKMDPINAMRY